MPRTLRPARPDDADAVAAFTGDTWPDEPVEDYLPDVFETWAASDDSGDRTLVAVVDGTVVGLCHAVLCTPEEGWLEGIRVHPDHRGAGHGRALTDALLTWCRECGTTVARNLVFDWNEAGLAQSRATGFAPVTTFRWAHPEPADVDVPDTVRGEPATAWRYWTDSDARTHLGGLALDPEESWAVSELTRERLGTLAAEQRVFTLDREDCRGVVARTRTVERETAGDDHCGDDPEADDTTETVVEYGVAAWTGRGAAETLLDAVRTDAATLCADATRVLIPDTARYLSDAAATGVALSEEALVVHAAPLVGR